MEREQLIRQMITDYKKKVEMYQAMIAEWEREIGVGDPNQGASTPSLTESGSGSPSGAKLKPGADVATLIREFEFYGKSQTAAAKSVLERVGHPMKTKQVLDAIERGGVTVGHTGCARAQWLVNCTE